MSVLISLCFELKERTQGPFQVILEIINIIQNSQKRGIGDAGTKSVGNVEENSSTTKKFT